jgi:hypothetical protein
MKKVKIFFAIFILSLTSNIISQEMSVPPDLQAALFKKIFGFDKTLSGMPKVLILYSDGSAGVKDQLIKSFSGVGITAVGVKADQLAGSLGAGTVVYVAPGVSSPKGQTGSKNVLSISGVTSLVENGSVSVGLGTEGGKPKIIVHMGQLKAEGHELSADLLKLAKVIQ